MRLWHRFMAGLAALAGLWLYRKGRKSAQAQDLHDYAGIRERMDDAQGFDSVDAARGWLRERPKGRR